MPNWSTVWYERCVTCLRSITLAVSNAVVLRCVIDSTCTRYMHKCIPIRKWVYGAQYSIWNSMVPKPKINRVCLVIWGTSVLVDMGSTNSFITASLAKRPNLSGHQHNYVMKTICRVKPACSKVEEINLSAVDGSFAEDISNVLVETSIPAKYPMHDIDVSKYPHLSDLPITPVDQGSPVEILVGMDNSHLILPLEFRSNPRSLKDPFATRSVFGWVLNWHVGDGDIGEITSLFVQLDEKFERLWQMENDMTDTGGSYSVEDREVIDLWERKVKQENDNYILPIPWRNGCANLPNNKCIAEHRLNGLTKRLDRLVWPRYMIKTFRKWFKVVMLNAFQRMNWIVQCGTSHIALRSNLVKWDQFFIVQWGTREWVWMVNVCKNRAWQITSFTCCSDFDNLSRPTPSWPMWRVCELKYVSSSGVVVGAQARLAG